MEDVSRRQKAVGKRQKAKSKRQKARIADGINKKIQISNYCCTSNIDSGSYQVIGFEPFQK
jgi:hypothetical protein